MVNTKYYFLSVVSGCLWGALGYYLSHLLWPNLVWAPVAVSPLIGLGMGLLYRHACLSSLPHRVVLSLVTLFLAVTLFGLAAGVYDALRDIPPNPFGGRRILSAVVIQAVVAAWWGVTFTGYFLVLWPLSFLNHTLVCRFGCSRLSSRCS
jgi:hypothetical protein